MEPYRIVRPIHPRELLAGAISEWDIYDRATGEVMGTVARDDAEECGLEYDSSNQHLWHAWLADPDGTIDGEALPMRYATRREAVRDLYDEWRSDRERGPAVPDAR